MIPRRRRGRRGRDGPQHASVFGPGEPTLKDKRRVFAQTACVPRAGCVCMTASSRKELTDTCSLQPLCSSAQTQTHTSSSRLKNPVRISTSTTSPELHNKCTHTPTHPKKKQTAENTKRASPPPPAQHPSTVPAICRFH